jgi:hypothetical protein
LTIRVDYESILSLQINFNNSASLTNSPERRPTWVKEIADQNVARFGAALTALIARKRKRPTPTRPSPDRIIAVISSRK